MRFPKLYSVRDLAIDMEIVLFPGQNLLWFPVLLLLSLQHNRRKPVKSSSANNFSVAIDNRCNATNASSGVGIDYTFG